MATTIQVSENISVSKYIEINGQRCEVEAISFSPAITEASAKDAIFQTMEQEMLERKIIQKNESGQYVLCDSGDLLIPEEDWEDENEPVCYGQWVKLSEFQKQSQLLWDAFMALDHADHDERLAMLDKLKNHFDKVGKPTKTKQ